MICHNWNIQENNSNFSPKCKSRKLSATFMLTSGCGPLVDTISCFFLEQWAAFCWLLFQIGYFYFNVTCRYHVCKLSSKNLLVAHQIIMGLVFHPRVLDRMIGRLRCTICDRFEQKQADGCVLTNPLNATPLRPGSTFIDGFSKLIPQRIAVEISYLLVYCPWKSINKCGVGTQWRSV